MRGPELNVLPVHAAPAGEAVAEVHVHAAPAGEAAAPAAVAEAVAEVAPRAGGEGADPQVASADAEV